MGITPFRGRKTGGSTVLRARENQGQLRLVASPQPPAAPPFPSKLRSAQLTINSGNYRKNADMRTVVEGIKEVGLFGGIAIKIIEEPKWNQQPLLEDRGKQIEGLPEIAVHIIREAGAYLKIHRLGLGKK